MTSLLPTAQAPLTSPVLDPGLTQPAGPISNPNASAITNVKSTVTVTGTTSTREPRDSTNIHVAVRCRPIIPNSDGDE